MRTFPSMAAAVVALATLLSPLTVPQARAQDSDTARPPDHAASAPHSVTPPKPPAVTKPAPPVSSVVVPVAPPPPPVLPPPIEVPVRPVPPPPPPPIADDAPGSFSKIASGLRVTFGPDRADLNPGTAGALRTLAHTAPPGSDTAFNVTGFAASTADDPSAARRLSLSRALAARSVLIGEGIPSIRIYVKALGTPTVSIATGAPDRVDVTIAVHPPSSSAPSPPQKAAP